MRRSVASLESWLSSHDLLRWPVVLRDPRLVEVLCGAVGLLTSWLVVVVEKYCPWRVGIIVAARNVERLMASTFWSGLLLKNRGSCVDILNANRSIFRIPNCCWISLNIDLDSVSVLIDPWLFEILCLLWCSPSPGCGAVTRVIPFSCTMSPAPWSARTGRRIEFPLMLWHCPAE